MESNLKPVDYGHLYRTDCGGDCGGTCMVCCCGYCVKCMGYEGGLPTECPGRILTFDESDAIYQGRLDFREGQWTDVGSSINSPVHYREMQDLRSKE